MVGVTKVRGRSNVLAGLFLATFPLIVASAPVGAGGLRALWTTFWISVVVVLIVRSIRMSVSAHPFGLVVRNLGRDYRVPWTDVAAIEAGRSDNVTGAVTTIVIQRHDGTALIGRGASSYSRRTVENWRDALVAAQRTYA